MGQKLDAQDHHIPGQAVEAVAISKTQQWERSLHCIMVQLLVLHMLK